jgi:hypothetical protein
MLLTGNFVLCSDYKYALGGIGVTGVFLMNEAFFSVNVKKVCPNLSLANVNIVLVLLFFD